MQTQASAGTIVQLNVSRGGVPKAAIAEAVVGERGIAGDRQADRRHHGGPDRALCLFPLEQIAALRADGHPIQPGCTGENITTAGLDWRCVLPGARLLLGESVLIEVTGYADPCWKNARWFTDGDFNRISQRLHPGASRVYARVLQGGALRPGDPAVLLTESVTERVQRQQPRTFRWPRDFR